MLTAVKGSFSFANIGCFFFALAVAPLNESCRADECTRHTRHTPERVMSNILKSHVTHMNESCHTHE